MTRQISDSESVRRLIRDAMQRLLEGSPIRSDGKLTIKSLADEAGVKRWVLTHQNPDLQQEFRDRCTSQDAVPDSLRKITGEHDSLKVEVSKMKNRIRDLTEENHRFIRIIHVLTLENTQMREMQNNQMKKIHPLR